MTTRSMRRPGRRPPPQAEDRNQRIAQGYADGRSLADLAREEGITRQRAWQICKEQFEKEEPDD